MKLIKINTDHYVVVDDSEIDYDNEPYLLIKDDYETYIHKHKGDNKPTTEHYKITHSTQPLEEKQQAPTHTNNGVFINFNSQKVYNKVKELSLQKVKELIGEVNVEKWAELYVWGGVYLTEQEKQQTEIAYMTGYNQSLEDNKEKKYTEEDLRMAYKEGAKSQRFNAHLDGSEKTIDETIQFLQPKTEWEVEIVDGKLKLV